MTTNTVLLDDLNARIRRRRREREHLVRLLDEVADVNESRAARIAEDIKVVEVDLIYLQAWIEAETEDVAA